MDLDPDAIDVTSFDNEHYKSSTSGLIDTSGIQYLTVNATKFSDAEKIWNKAAESHDCWLKIKIPDKEENTYIPIIPIKTSAYNLSVNDRITNRLKFTIAGDFQFDTLLEKEEKMKIYGVRGMGSVNPEDLSREDDAVGLSCEVGISEIRSDFDNCYPWNKIREVKDKFGNSFVRIPKFYSKVSFDYRGYFSYQISGYPHEGFSTLFVDGKGNEIDYVLVGKYESSGTSQKVESKSGKEVLSNFTIGDMRNACRSNGEGYQQYDFLIDNIIRQLFTVEFATTNSQSIMAGITNSDTYSQCLITGQTDPVKTASGSWKKGNPVLSSNYNLDGLHACKYRGIENPWGNFYKFCDGISFSGGKAYICLDPTEYADEKHESPYMLAGSIASEGGYNTQMEPFENFPLLAYCSEVHGDEYSYFCDYYYDGGSTLSIGGSWDEDGLAGIWCFNGSNDSNYSSENFCSRLCYKPI